MAAPDPTPSMPMSYRRVSPEEARAALVGKLVRWGVRLTVVLGAIVVLVVVLTPSSGRMRPPTQKAICASQLRQIGQACHLFANENRGRFPSSLDELLRTQDVSIDLFTCPATDDDAARSYPGVVPAGWADALGSYLYYGAGLTTTVPDDVIVARDRSFSHHAPAFSGVNVLFADGRAAFLTEPELLVATEKSNTLREAWEASGRKPAPPTSRPAK